MRKLIPEAIPGSTVADVVTARADYAELDALRTRADSSEQHGRRVKHVGDPATAKEVEIAYVKGGKLQTVRAANCILACWHVVIPYICEELPEKQKEALGFRAESSAALHQRGAPQLDVVSESWAPTPSTPPACYHTRAQSRFAGQHRRTTSVPRNPTTPSSFT